MSVSRGELTITVFIVCLCARVGRDAEHHGGVMYRASRAALDTPLNTRTYVSLTYHYLRVRQAAESVNLTKLRVPLAGTAADSGVIAGAGGY